MRDRRKTLAVAAVATAAALWGLGLMTSTPAAAGLCAAKCLVAYNACRIAKKGSPQCDVDYTDCLQKCRKKH